MNRKRFSTRWLTLAAALAGCELVAPLDSMPGSWGHDDRAAAGAAGAAGEPVGIAGGQDGNGGVQQSGGSAGDQVPAMGGAGATGRGAGTDAGGEGGHGSPGGSASGADSGDMNVGKAAFGGEAGWDGEGGEGGNASLGGSSGSGRAPGRRGCTPPMANMVCIPGGTFAMGTVDLPPDYHTIPVHEVTLDAFQMDVTEVTVRAYAECVRAGACEEPAVDESCTYGMPGHSLYAVNCVNFEQAQAFCAWSGKRLPSEEEWEYAARRPDGTGLPGGPAGLGATRANFCGEECRFDWREVGWDDGQPEVAPVGSYPSGATIDGVLDLAGNVWEWTASPRCEYPASPCNACPPDVSCANPCGGCTTPERVLRGRAWSDSVDPQAFFGRASGSVSDWSAITGFRCVR